MSRTRVGPLPQPRGVIDKPILELLTLGSNLDIVDFLLKKLNFQAVIKSAASAASPIAWGEPRSRRPPAEAVVLALFSFFQ